MTHGSMGFYTPCRNDDFFDENIAGLDIKSQASMFSFFVIKISGPNDCKIINFKYL